MSFGLGVFCHTYLRSQACHHQIRTSLSVLDRLRNESQCAFLVGEAPIASYLSFPPRFNPVLVALELSDTKPGKQKP
jgi:hypothetical protein